jgi:hypothetical protein
MRGRLLVLIIFFISVLFLNLPKIKAADTDVVINEVMVDPSCSNDACEWIELYNNGDTTINLKNWSLDTKVISTDTLIKSDDYLIITKNLAEFNKVYSVDPDKVIQLSIALTNSGKTLKLDNGDSPALNIDSYAWTLSDVKTDFSLERVNPNKSDWKLSLVSGGTPGEENSVSKKLPPLSKPTGVLPTDKQNMTGATSVNFSWTNPNSSSTACEFILSEKSDLSDSDIDETKITTNKYLAEDLDFGSYYWQIIVSDGTNEKKSDIYQFTLIKPSYSDAIVINELMPNPTGDEAANEWIELFNNSDDSVDLTGWSLEDIEGATNKFTIDSGQIDSHGFAIFPRPQTGITLNNDADGVKLYQPDGNLLYQTPEFSLSQKDYTWARQDNGDFGWTATPTLGKANIFYLPLPLASTGLSPINQNIPLGANLNFEWSSDNQETQTYELVLSDQSDLSHILLDQSGLTKTQFQFIPDTNYSPQNYYWQVKTFNSAGSTDSEIYTFNLYNPVYSSAITVSELMPNPADEATNEWIELYNNSAEPVDLTDWKLSDISGSTHLFTIGDTQIEPYQFLVFSRSQTGIVLNNDADGAKIIQPNGQVLMQTPLFASAPTGYAWAENSAGSFSWTATPTPGASNIFYLPPVASGDTTDKEKPVINKNPIKIKTGDFHAFQDKLVEISGTVISTNGHTFYLDDGSGQAKIYIQDQTQIKKPPMHKGDTFGIIGVVDLYRNVWRILPRSQDDIWLIQLADNKKTQTTANSSKTAKKSVADSGNLGSSSNGARAPTTLLPPLIGQAKASALGASNQPSPVHVDPWWVQIVKLVIALAVIFTLLLVVKIKTISRIKITGGHFGDDET